MNRRFFSFAVSLVLPILTACAAQTPAAAGPDDAHGAMAVSRATVLEFGPITPPGFQPGMQIAVLSGNPAAAGPYTLRLSFPDGYRFPAHWHPQVENLTVLSGTFLLGEGTQENWQNLTTYVPGDYLHIPARSSHYGGATGATVIQLHGTGPFDIILSNPQAAGGN